MKRTVLAGMAMGLLMSTLWGSSARAQTNNFTATYKGGSSSCGTSYSIQGQEPSTAGSYPVFIYLVGTSETYNNSQATAAVNYMASHGYVAATVQYPNSTFGDCTTLSARAKCIFDSTSASSAVAALCARADAACSKGIVVAGFSQGSVLGILSKNYDSAVQAVFGMGAGVSYSTYDLTSCVANGNRTLTSDHLRAINGEADGFMGSTQSSVRSELQQLTGMTCTSTSTSCALSNNSGWEIVLNSDVSDGTADHCYMRMGGCTVSENTLDQKWLNGTYAWSLDPNLSWLTNFTQH